MVSIVLNIINNVLKTDIDENNLYDSLVEKGLDSLNFIHIIIELEEKFNIEFLDTQLIFQNFTTAASYIKEIELVLEKSGKSDDSK